MKRIFTLTLLVFLFNAAAFAQVGINKDGSTPDSSSMLDIRSTTQGILIPRMTSIQRAAIKSPAKGLMVYDSTTTSFWFHNGVAWTEIGGGASGSGWNLTGNSGLASGTNFIGTTDKEPLIFKVNSIVAGRLDTTSNVAYGVGTLAGNSAGFYGNTAIGNMAMYTNGTGGANASLDEGTRNTAIGFDAMYANTKGLYNTAVGYTAMAANTIGYFNTGLGYGALSTNVNGINNTAVGLGALNYNTSGNGNTAIGIRAAQNNTVGYSNIAIGGWALYNNIAANNLIAIGDSTLMNQQVNRLGWYYNIAIGTKALYANTTGVENTALGYTALTANVSGTNNTANGFDALLGNTTGIYNTGFGSRALNLNATGSYNTGIGGSTLNLNNTGSYNTAIGYSAITAKDGLTNATAIGALATVSQSNSMVLGSISGQNGATASTAVGIGVAAPLAPLHIHSANADNYYNAKTLYLDDANSVPSIHFQGSGTYASRWWNITLEPFTPTSGDNAGIPTTDLVFSNNFGYPQVRFENGLTQFLGDVHMYDDATVEGTLHLSNSISYSDANLKKDIEPLENALPEVMKLGGYRYYWKNNKDTTEQIGVIAQEVQKVFPQLVKADSKGILGVNYQGLIPVLLTAVKEQQNEIDELKKRLDRIEATMKTK